MSRFDELIARICLDGVEYFALGQVAKLTMGTSPKGDSISNNSSDGLEFHQGKSFFSDTYVNNSNMFTSTPIKNAESGSIIMSVRAPVGDCNLTDRKIAIGRGLCSMSGKEGLDTKFLYYYINSIIYEIKQKATGSTFEAINTNDVKSISIPLPPLLIQEEIVRILDNFTELTAGLIAELTAELTARKKQYEYYRDMLLAFGDVVPMLTLGEVCSIQSGGTPSRKEHKYWERGTIKWLSSTVCQNRKTVNEITDYISEHGYKNSSVKLMKEETTLVALVGATIGKVAFLPFEAAINQNIAGIYPTDTTKLNPSYVFYACSMLYNNFIGLSQGRLAMANLSFVKALKIPIPPLAEQKRIVSILDRFDALCNDLTSGLSAEIEARQKQYEYYRNKLLQFKMLNA